jgi:hypothetical protein
LIKNDEAIDLAIAAKALPKVWQKAERSGESGSVEAKLTFCR